MINRNVTYTDSDSKQESTIQIDKLDLHEWARKVASDANNNAIEMAEFDRLNKIVEDEHIDNRIAAKDDNNETILHILVRKRRFDLVVFILTHVNHDRVASILNIQNNQGNTILHLIFVEHENIYENINIDDMLEYDFKCLFNFYPRHERYNVMFDIKNADSNTVFSMLPVNDFSKLSIKIFNEELTYILRIVENIERFYALSINTSTIFTYDKLSAKTKIQMILDRPDLNRHLKIAIAHYDKYDRGNIELLKQIYFIFSDPHSLLINYSTIFKLANFFNSVNEFEIMTIQSGEVKNRYPELVHAIQFEILYQNLRNNIDNYSIFKLADVTSMLFKEKYGTLNNDRKSSFDKLRLLILDFFLIYVKHRDSANDMIKTALLRLLQILEDSYDDIKQKLISYEGLTLEDINAQVEHLQETCGNIENEIKEYREIEYKKLQIRQDNISNDINNNNIYTEEKFEDVTHVINAKDHYLQTTTQSLVSSIDVDLDWIVNYSSSPFEACKIKDTEGDPAFHRILNLYNGFPSERQAWVKKLQNLIEYLVKFENSTITNSNENSLYNLIIEKNYDGYTVLHLAALYGYDEIIKIIISPLKGSYREAALNYPDKTYQESVLHIAARKSPEKFDQFFALYSPASRLHAMTLKNFAGISVFHYIDSDSGINLLTDVFMIFTKLYRLLASGFHDNWMTTIIADNNIEDIKHKYIECMFSSNANTHKALQLAFEYYDNYKITNMELFAKLYFVLVPSDSTNICKKTISKIKHAIEGTTYDESKAEDLDIFLVNEIEMRILEKKDSYITSSGLLISRAKLIKILDDFTKDLFFIRPSMIEIDEFVLRMLRICVDYNSNNISRDAKKYELLTCLNNVYDSLVNNPELTNFKHAYNSLKEECREIASAIEKDHAKSIFSKLGTKSRLAKPIRRVLEKYDEKNQSTTTPITTSTSSSTSSDSESDSPTDYSNIWAPPMPIWAGSGLSISPVATLYPSTSSFNKWPITHVIPEDNKKIQKIVIAFEEIYPILYNADHSLIKINFLTGSFLMLSPYEKISRIEFSLEPMVCQAYKLAKEHCDHYDSSNYQLIFQIYEVVDSELYKTFTVSQRLINNIVTALNKDDNKKMDKSDIVEEYSDIICHIKMSALKKSDKILDLGIFNSREQALNGILDIGSESTERTKAFNRLDLFICNLLKIYVTYNPKKNQNRIENKAKLYTILKNAYEACVNEPALTVEKMTEITNNLYNTCRTIAHDVDNDHQDKGPLAKVGKKSKFAKCITKELKTFKPEDFKDKKKLNHEPSTKKQSNRNRLFELPEHLQSDNNNEADDLIQYNNIVKFLKFKDIKTQELLISLMQKEASNQATDNSNNTSERRKSARITKFFATTQRDIEDKTEIIRSIVNHIKQAQINLENPSEEKHNIKDALIELKAHLESKMKELKGKSIRHHSETANDLEYFIKEMIDPKIVSRVDATDDASTFNKKYKARIPNFQL